MCKITVHASFLLLLLSGACANDPIVGGPQKPVISTRTCCPAELPPELTQTFEGVSCCADGRWQANEGDGSPDCGTAGVCTVPETDLPAPAPGPRESSPNCCVDAEKPGNNEKPPCFEGASCCADGNWQCNNNDGSPHCGAIDVCTE